MGAARCRHGVRHPFCKSPSARSVFFSVDVYNKQIMSHASSPGNDITVDAKAKINAYTKGLLSPWTPQQTILEHPVRFHLVSVPCNSLFVTCIPAAAGNGMVPHPRWPQQRHGGRHGGRAHVCASFSQHIL